MLRDVVILFVLTVAGSFIIGFATAASGGRSLPAGAIALSNLVFSHDRLYHCWMLAKGSRWLHLSCVAFGLWLVSVVNVVFTGSIALWFAGAFFIAFVMALGGGLSYLFVRSDR